MRKSGELLTLVKGVIPIGAGFLPLPLDDPLAGRRRGLPSEAMGAPCGVLPRGVSEETETDDRDTTDAELGNGLDDGLSELPRQGGVGGWANWLVKRRASRSREDAVCAVDVDPIEEAMEWRAEVSAS